METTFQNSCASIGAQWWSFAHLFEGYNFFGTKRVDLSDQKPVKNLQAILKLLMCKRVGRELWQTIWSKKTAEILESVKDEFS